MKRFTLHSYLKPEKVEDYILLHASPWPELMELLDSCHMHHYSIAIRGTELFTYYEYTGDDYEKDNERLSQSPVMERWWKYSKPCFLYHDEGRYYDDLTEVFYKE